MYGIVNTETLVFLPNGEQVKLGALGTAEEVIGHKELPGFFYDAVHYGITAANPGLLMLTVSSSTSFVSTNSGMMNDSSLLSIHNTKSVDRGRNQASEC